MIFLLVKLIFANQNFFWKETITLLHYSGHPIYIGPAVIGHPIHTFITYIEKHNFYKMQFFYLLGGDGLLDLLPDLDSEDPEDLEDLDLDLESLDSPRPRWSLGDWLRLGSLDPRLPTSASLFSCSLLADFLGVSFVGRSDPSLSTLDWPLPLLPDLLWLPLLHSRIVCNSIPSFATIYKKLTMPWK